jgi:hypothetical protein
MNRYAVESLPGAKPKGQPRHSSSAAILPMNTTTEHPAPAERPAPERQERKEPTYLFIAKYVADKSETARRFLDTRARLNPTSTRRTTSW